LTATSPGRTGTSLRRRPTRRSSASSPTRYDRSASPAGTTAVRDDAVLGDRRPGSIARRRRARVGRDLEAAPEGGVLHHAVGGAGQCPPGLRWPGGGDRAVVSRAGGGRHRDGRRDSRRRGGRAGPDRRVPGQGLPGAGWRWHSVSFPSASAGWISNSSRPAPSAREWSTSATAWRASWLVRRALGRTGQPVA
jgi:hypothetical protein